VYFLILHYPNSASITSKVIFYLLLHTLQPTVSFPMLVQLTHCAKCVYFNYAAKIATVIKRYEKNRNREIYCPNRVWKENWNKVSK